MSISVLKNGGFKPEDFMNYSKKDFWDVWSYHYYDRELSEKTNDYLGEMVYAAMHRLATMRKGKLYMSDLYKDVSEKYNVSESTVMVTINRFFNKEYPDFSASQIFFRTLIDFKYDYDEFYVKGEHYGA